MLPSIALLALAATSCSKEECQDPLDPPFTVSFRVTVVFEDIAGDPLAGEPVRVDVWKETCDDEIRRTQLMPASGTTDPDGCFVPPLVGYDLHDALDSVHVSGTFSDNALYRGWQSVFFSAMDLKELSSPRQKDVSITVTGSPR